MGQSKLHYFLLPEHPCAPCPYPLGWMIRGRSVSGLTMHWWGCEPALLIVSKNAKRGQASKSTQSRRRNVFFSTVQWFFFWALPNSINSLRQNSQQQRHKKKATVVESSLWYMSQWASQWIKTGIFNLKERTKVQNTLILSLICIYLYICFGSNQAKKKHLAWKIEP